VLTLVTIARSGTSVNTNFLFDTTVKSVYVFVMARKEPQRSYQYGEIEAAIIEALSVKPESVKALKARLLHLRNLGVPTLPKPGSGQKISYTWLMGFEMLVTVALERGGYTPRLAAQVGPEICRHASIYAPFLANDPTFALLMPEEEVKLDGDNKDLLLFWNGKPVGIVATGYGELRSRLQHNASHFCGILNVTALWRKYEKALKNRAPA
jgi:hypothetical protein